MQDKLESSGIPTPREAFVDGAQISLTIEAKLRAANIRGALDSLERILDAVIPSGAARHEIQQNIDAIWGLSTRKIQEDYTDV